MLGQELYPLELGSSPGTQLFEDFCRQCMVSEFPAHLQEICSETVTAICPDVHRGSTPTGKSSGWNVHAMMS